MDLEDRMEQQINLVSAVIGAKLNAFKSVLTEDQLTAYHLELQAQRESLKDRLAPVLSPELLDEVLKSLH